MKAKTKPQPNVKEAVPFLGVTDIERSLRYYVEGLGFEMVQTWRHDGKLRWCRLELGEAAIMLQEFWKEGQHANVPQGKLGNGVTICFICRDALAKYHDAIAHGIAATRPFVGNGMWVTSLTDPDGYRLDFESQTDVPEETEYKEQVTGFPAE